MGAVCQKWLGRPDLDAYRSRFEPLSYSLGPWVVDSHPFRYKGIQGAFEEPWISGAGSAWEPELLRRHDQGHVGPSRGLEDPNVPLSTPTGVRLAPTSPMFVEGFFRELRLDGVLRSSPHASNTK